ncbi:MAG: Asp-tRNA(Asn)/Glu-tRNA(Gln) amidotransferase subunit GatC, partial [Oscillospiraceae bacterium]
IRQIAKLAKLKIEEDKIGKFEIEIRKMVEMIENLPDIHKEYSDLDEHTPMLLRKDSIEPSLKREDVLKNAPQTQVGCLVVPKTVE